MCAQPRVPDRSARVGTKGLSRLLAGFEGAAVTLYTRTYLDDEVVRRVREWVCRAAGREIVLEVNVVPTQDAGAILYVGDSGRVVLDPRTMWLSEVQRGLRDRVERGEVVGATEAYDYLRSRLGTAPGPSSAEELRDTGSVMRVGDGVALVAGLRDVGSQELLEFEGGNLGIAFSLRESNVGVVLLGCEDGIREGGDVQRSGHPVRVPAGEAVLGRVVDALGHPIDSQGPIVPSAWMPVQHSAPGVVERAPVDEPLHTGLKTVDALVPIGRGQRELIIGDRKIGKTSLAVDTILAQKGRDVACVYCAIGQKASTVRQVVATLENEGALEYTAVVVALPAEMPAMRYLAPYTACAMGEFFMYRGKDALVIYDDLSKHAATYREMSALLDRPVGREAYPGDIFYVHSRLLERAARLSEANGGGSLTALPIVETLEGDISAFIPTNVISICDGQIVLDAAAFNEGRRPAMDAGLSVSRVGGSAQPSAMKRVAGRLRIDLAQYQEMARFVKFGAEVDEATRRQLVRGERARELLKQGLHVPMPLEQELLVLFAAVNGHFDEVDVDRLGEVEAELLHWVQARRPDTLRLLAQSSTLDDGIEEQIAAALEAFFAESRVLKRSERLQAVDAGWTAELGASEGGR